MAGDNEEPDLIFLGLHGQGDTTAVRVDFNDTYMYVHEDYDDETFDNDIMLIRLDGDVTFNDMVNKAGTEKNKVEI